MKARWSQVGVPGAITGKCTVSQWVITLPRSLSQGKRVLRSVVCLSAKRESYARLNAKAGTRREEVAKNLAHFLLGRLLILHDFFSYSEGG